MTFYICTMVFVALAAAFIILTLTKWGVIEYMQVHGSKILSELFSCYLCLSFWVCVILCGFVTLISRDLLVMFIPIFSSVITRKML